MSAGLSVVLVTQNAEKTIEACLRSVQGLGGELIVVDGGSTDKTLEIAGRYGAQIHRRKLEGFGAQKQAAVDRAAGPWVFLIDSDEEAPADLAAEIRRAVEEPSSPAAFRVARRNRYFGRWLRRGGKYPDYQTRLFRKADCRFSDDLVHEKLLVNGRTATLPGALEHHSYPDVETWCRKLALFAEFRARELSARGLKPGAAACLRFCLWRPSWRFVRRYLFKGGFLDGVPGLLACVHDALTEILGYWLLASRAER